MAQTKIVGGEKYSPEQLTHGSSPWKLGHAKANEAMAKTEKDTKEYHSYIYRNPKDSKDFAATPIHEGGKKDPYTNTTAILPFPTVRNYRPWGVAMSESKKTLVFFAIIMSTPSL
jgi:hypothetical protein